MATCDLRDLVLLLWPTVLPTKSLFRSTNYLQQHRIIGKIQKKREREREHAGQERKKIIDKMQSAICSGLLRHIMHVTLHPSTMCWCRPWQPCDH